MFLQNHIELLGSSNLFQVEIFTTDRKQPRSKILLQYAIFHLSKTLF